MCAGFYFHDGVVRGRHLDSIAWLIAVTHDVVKWPLVFGGEIVGTETVPCFGAWICGSGITSAVRGPTSN